MYQDAEGLVQVEKDFVIFADGYEINKDFILQRGRQIEGDGGCGQRMSEWGVGTRDQSQVSCIAGRFFTV